MDFCKIRVLPGEEFDDLDAGKELLEKFGALIGENHSLPAEDKQVTHEPGLYWCYDKEDCETSQSAGAQVDQKDNQTDDQLDWSGPARVKELGSEVDTRNISGDVVNQFSVGVDMTSTSGEGNSLIVYRGDQSCA